MNRYILCSLLLLLCAGCATGRPDPPRNARVIEVPMRTTGYCKCKQCCGWKRTWYGKPVVKGSRQRKEVGVTATGSKARPGTIAADTSRYPFGTVMYIPGYGYGRVEDRGSAVKGEHIDLYFKKHKQALRWGSRQIGVKVFVPRQTQAARGR
jgi:3D (Asp-Asp-Asp) domain-containing protein